MWVCPWREVDRSFLISYDRNGIGRFLSLVGVIEGGTGMIVVSKGRKA